MAEERWGASSQVYKGDVIREIVKKRQEDEAKIDQIPLSEIEDVVKEAIKPKKQRKK